MKRLSIVLSLLAAVLGVRSAVGAQSTDIPAGAVDPAATVLRVKPSATDATISASDFAHVVIYDRKAEPGNILLFLSGSGGRPPGPLDFLNRAFAHGYRVIYLTYVDDQPVNSVCTGENLRTDPYCARKLRDRRAYGIGNMPLIPDAPQDAIVHRFTKLLAYLALTDPQGHWERYLDDGGAPRWSHVAVAGFSQGAGMAEFVAQRETVARVIAISGSSDFSAPDRIADWYFDKARTPPDRWFASYHVAEALAVAIPESYAALGIAKSHVFAMNLPVRAGQQAHTEGIWNPGYASVWDRLLGNGLMQQ